MFNSKETKMKSFLKNMVLLFAVLLSSIATADEDISGTWQGSLAIGPDTKLAIQFIISQTPDGSYAVVLNTPNEGNVKNVEANEVAYDAGNLKIEVTELSGSYDGVFKDGKIEGEWQQEGTSFPLTLKPYEKPTLSRKDMDMLLGTWQGKPVMPEGVMVSGELPTYLFQFEMSEQGEFTGTFTMAEMGMQGQRLTDMGVSDGIFTFKIGEMQKFKGDLTDKEIVGVLKFMGDANFPGESLTLVKGEYEAPVYNLNLPEEIKDQLSGVWNGIHTMKLQMMDQTISMAYEVRFERSEDGNFLGFLDVPEQGTSGLAITDASMNEGNLVLAVKAMGGEFTGRISEDKISGDWTQMGAETSSLILNRGKYVPPVYALNLDEEIMDRLAGKWSGKFQDIDVTFRFEKAESGDFRGFVDRPEVGQKDLPVTDANLSEGKLTLKIKTLIPSEFIAEFSGDQLAGDWKQMENSTPLTLDKEKP